MKLIKHSDVTALGIVPKQYLQWVENTFSIQSKVILPAKTSISLPDSGFYNTMPCYLPMQNVMGVKVVSRILGNEPAIEGTIILNDSITGEILCLMDGTLITSMRTGAVAALTILKLKNSSESPVLSIMGLGATSRATMLCLLESNPSQKFCVKLLRYKDQAECFISRFSNYSNVEFMIVDNYQDLIQGADVVLSAISSATQTYAKDEWFKPGVLVVPIHTRGFENCDLFFDKVYGDLTNQISHFGNFDKFKYFNEFDKVIKGEDSGRDNNEQRILVYNIGIAIHDIFIANEIYNMSLKSDFNIEDCNFKEKIEKVYI